MASEGVSFCFGNGDETIDVAKRLASFGYDVCILMDSDKYTDKMAIDDLLEKWDIPTFAWEPGNSIEEQIFQDVSNQTALELLQIPIQERGLELVTDKLKKELGTINVDISSFNGLTKEQRKSIGTISKANSEKQSWYKRIDLGEEMGNVVFRNWTQIDDSANLKNVTQKLIEWISK